MIVPGHVFFLWRIIHQHFTLAFLEHVSPGRWDTPSWSQENKLICQNKTKCEVQPVEHSGPVSSRVVFAALRSVFDYFSSSKSRGFFLWKHGLFIHRGSGSFSFSFRVTLAAGSAGVWWMFGAFLRRPDHLDLRPSLRPHPPHAPAHCGYHGRGERTNENL